MCGFLKKNISIVGKIQKVCFLFGSETKGCGSGSGIYLGIDIIIF
jgi:hypothetical protein